MPQTTSGAAEAPTILLLEDEPAVRRSLQLLLQGSGFAVRSYASGAMLLADPRAKDAAVLVVDYRLADGNGLAVARALHEAGFAGRSILITAYPSRELSATAQAEGFSRIFEKPLANRVLVEAVAELVR
jgi:FixJ family two-component response regulator